MTGELDNSFGFQTVEASERRARIRRVFAAVAARYDLMNDLMSFALHRRWKRRFIEAIAPRPGEIIVDLAGGTGDVAIGLARFGVRQVIVCDPSVEMMQVGRKRGAAHVEWVAGEAEELPFATGAIDCVTISFGIRNVTRLDRALIEIARVLKPGGRLLCLEFSTPRRWVKPFYDVFSFAVIPRLGAAVARAPEAYAYLVESIRRFPDQEMFKAMLEAAGFRDVTYFDLMFGVVAFTPGASPARGDRSARKTTGGLADAYSQSGRSQRHSLRLIQPAVQQRGRPIERPLETEASRPWRSRERWPG